jgi:hypothetical protein
MVPDLFALGYFLDKFSHFCIAGITGVTTMPRLIIEMGFLNFFFFCLGWTQTVILLIFTSQVGGILELHRNALLVA